MTCSTMTWDDHQNRVIVGGLYSTGYIIVRSHVFGTLRYDAPIFEAFAYLQL